VPQKYAHAWVEAYVKPKGWIRLDPTPSMPNSSASLGSGVSYEKLTILMDTLNYYWYVLVINYNLEKQFSILLKLRSELRRPNMGITFRRDTALKWLAILILIFCAGIALIVIIQDRLKPPEQKVLALFLKKIKKHGYHKKSTQGLEEFVSQIPNNEVRQSASVFVKEFEALYFKDKSFRPQDIQKLKKTIQAIGA
jgi:hypothetical protein